jgi:acyl-CoA thioesterase FadM
MVETAFSRLMADSTDNASRANRRQEVGVSIFQVTVPIRPTDIDVGGVVRNDVYFQLLEEARLRLFNESGLARVAYGDQGPYAFSTLAEVRGRFLAFSRWPAHLTVDTRVIEVGTKSFQFEYAIRDAETSERRAEGFSVQVWLNRALAASRIPETARAILEANLEPSVAARPWTK